MASAQLFVFIALLSVACSATALSCERGCAGDFHPVQAEDGLFYLNSCVARCQGATLVAAPAAKAAAGRLRIVTQKLMQQFAAESYRFIDFARVRQGKSVGAPALEQLPADRIVRYDAVNGAIYATAAPAALPAAAEQLAAASRKLSFVQQQDERAAVATEAEAQPLAAVGELLTYGQKSHCSAVLVGERTILTAASCVFDRSSGAFARGLYFVPGRFRDASGKVHAPHGAADVAEVFVLSQYVSAGAAADIAVVRLQAANSLAGAVRYMPVAAQQQPAAAVPAVAASRRHLRGVEQQAAAPSFALTSAGYPADKAEGTLVRTACQAQQQGSSLQLTGCSVAQGQAGSPLVNVAGAVQGIVTVGSAAENRGLAITPFLWEVLIRPALV